MRQDDDDFDPGRLPTKEELALDAYDAKHTPEGLLKLLQDPANQADEECFTRLLRFGQDFLYVTNSELRHLIGVSAKTIDNRILARRGFGANDKSLIIQLYIEKLTSAMKRGEAVDCKGRRPIRKPAC